MQRKMRFMDGCSESGHGVSGCERRGCIEAGLPLKGTAKKRKKRISDKSY